MPGGRDIAVWLIAGSVLVLSGSGGCRSDQPENRAGSASAPADARYEDVVADADAERAKAALERDWPKGERRPNAPGRPPVVDQPRRTRR